MNSKIILAKNINIDKSYKNVLSYSESDMLALVNNSNNKIAESNTFSFIKHDKSLYVDFTYSQCLEATYIAFQNPDYSNKWFFAFVDDIEYKGNKNTEIFFTVDAWSTWFSNWSPKNAFVIREHVNNDAIGANLTPEDLAIDGVVCKSEETITSFTNYYVCVYSNWNPSLNNASGDGYNDVLQYNKNVYGNAIFFFDLSEAGIYNLSHFIYIVNKQGHIADIHDMFIVPKKAIKTTDLNLVSFVYGLSEVTCAFYELKYDNSMLDNITEESISITKNTSFTGFTPRNNKVYTYPYNYLYVTNNVGSNNIYKYEDFSTTNCVFDLQLALSIGMSGRIVPTYYKGQSENTDEALTLAKYPTCSWSADSYTNWLTQNSVNIAQTVVGGVASLATGNVVGTLASGANLFGQFFKAQLLPEITGGQTTGDVNYGNLNNNFKFCKMHAKIEFLRQIDDYFTKYGYKVNRLKTPNITGRRNYNYIEVSSDSEVGFGDVPNKYMEIINNICRNGVTIWHDNANVGNYSVNNDII